MGRPKRSVYAPLRGGALLGRGVAACVYSPPLAAAAPRNPALLPTYDADHVGKLLPADRAVVEYEAAAVFRAADTTPPRYGIYPESIAPLEARDIVSSAGGLHHVVGCVGAQPLSTAAAALFAALPAADAAAVAAQLPPPTVAQLRALSAQAPTPYDGTVMQLRMRRGGDTLLRVCADVTGYVYDYPRVAATVVAALEYYARSTGWPSWTPAAVQGLGLGVQWPPPPGASGVTVPPRWAPAAPLGSLPLWACSAASDSVSAAFAGERPLDSLWRGWVRPRALTALLSALCNVADGLAAWHAGGAYHMDLHASNIAAAQPQRAPRRAAEMLTAARADPSVLTADDVFEEELVGQVGRPGFVGPPRVPPAFVALDFGVGLTAAGTATLVGGPSAALLRSAVAASRAPPLTAPCGFYPPLSYLVHAHDADTPPYSWVQEQVSLRDLERGAALSAQRALDPTAAAAWPPADAALANVAEYVYAVASSLRSGFGHAAFLPVVPPLVGLKQFAAAHGVSYADDRGAELRAAVVRAMDSYSLGIALSRVLAAVCMQHFAEALPLAFRGDGGSMARQVGMDPVFFEAPLLRLAKLQLSLLQMGVTYGDAAREMRACAADMLQGVRAQREAALQVARAADAKFRAAAATTSDPSALTSSSSAASSASSSQLPPPPTQSEASKLRAEAPAFAPSSTAGAAATPTASSQSVASPAQLPYTAQLPQVG